MKKNSQLPTIRISTELNDKIIKCLNFINANENSFEISLSDFRRMALKYFSEKVLVEGLSLEFKPK